MSFNIVDGVVIAVIGAGIILGAFKGAFKMLLSFGSVVFAVIATFFLRPIIYPLLMEHTDLFGKMTTLISDNLDLTGVAKNLVNPETTTNNMTVSPQIMEMLAKKTGADSALAGLQFQISQHLAEIAMQIFSFIVGFILIMIAFAVAGFVLNRLDKLPVIREVNKTAGAVVGGVIGVVIIWIAMLVLNYWFSTGRQDELMLLIQQSMVTKYLYQYNLLVYYFILLQ